MTVVEERGGFDAAALGRKYAFLDDCPERFLDAAITLPFGDLSERVSGIRAWRDALLNGQLPPADSWPSEAIAAPVRRALERMGLACFCKNQPELTDDLLEDILAAFSRQDDAIREDVAGRLRELEELERAEARKREELEREAARLAEKWGTGAGRRRSRPVAWRLDDDAIRRLREQAEREVAGRPRPADTGLIENWEDLARAWAEIAGIFGDLGEMLGRGWDLTAGVLRHTGWRDLFRLRELVKRLPKFREIVQALGRLHVSETAESIVERVFIPMRRLEEERTEVRTPLVAGETRGIERSGSVARMLPVEAAMLGHPQLRLLWHARRAERALLTYRVEGVEIERTLVEKETSEEAEARRPRQERGPILAVVDTSGSMHGLPEQVAKALVLEALRTAHSEKRRCRLYAFSGPGQTAEHELALSPEGIGQLLAFLGLSFGGGSDPTAAMDRALEKLQENEWKKADVLLISDGEWPALPGLVAAARKAREAGTRFHGVQVGNRGRTGLHEICEPVHVFTDWNEYSRRRVKPITPHRRGGDKGKSPPDILVTRAGLRSHASARFISWEDCCPFQGPMAGLSSWTAHSPACRHPCFLLPSSSPSQSAVFESRPSIIRRAGRLYLGPMPKDTRGFLPDLFRHRHNSGAAAASGFSMPIIVAIACPTRSAAASTSASPTWA